MKALENPFQLLGLRQKPTKSKYCSFDLAGVIVLDSLVPKTVTRGVAKRAPRSD